MESFGEPSSPAHGNGQSPVHDSIRLIIFTWKAREAEFAVGALASERITIFWIWHEQRIFELAHKEQEVASAVNAIMALFFKRCREKEKYDPAHAEMLREN